MDATAPTHSGHRDALEPEVGCLAAFDFLSPEYAELFSRSPATAFQHPLWLDGLYRWLAPDRGAKARIVVGRENGRLRFVLPMIERSIWGIRLLESADLGVSDYAAPVADAEWLADADPTALRTAVQAALPAHDMMRIRPIRSDSAGIWSCFVDAAPRRLDFGAHAVALGPDYPSWRSAALSASFRKYLDRRKRRFLALPSAGIRRLESPEEAGPAILAMRDLRRGRFDGDMIQQPAAAEFYRELAMRGAASGFAATYVLEAEGETAGYVFGLAWRGRFHYLLIGCDYERFGRHSPGVILYDAIIEDRIALGDEVFDFTIGDEPFKMDFGTEPTGMFAMIGHPTWRGRLGHAALEARQRLGGGGKTADLGRTDDEGKT